MAVFSDRRAAFVRGLAAGVPIGLGYFAVSFSLGITARAAGISIIQGVTASFFTMASAGQYAGFAQIAEQAALWEIFILAVVTNARYLLMSCALGQRLDERTSLIHRFLLGTTITDEIFAVSIAQPGYLNPYYSYGALLASAPMWSAGTGLGIWAGELLPLRLVSALSVALYGMFLAVIIPKARKSRRVLPVVAVSFAASLGMSYCPGLRSLSGGTRTIILTVVIAALAAWLLPVPEEEEAGE